MLSIRPPSSTPRHHSLVLLFFLSVSVLLLDCAFSKFYPFPVLPPTSAADKKQQPVDAAVFHFFPAHRQLLRAQHVRGCGGGELSQVSAAAGRGGGAAEGGETTETTGEKEEK